MEAPVARATQATSAHAWPCACAPPPVWTSARLSCHPFWQEQGGQSTAGGQGLSWGGYFPQHLPLLLPTLSSSRLSAQRASWGPQGLPSLLSPSLAASIIPAVRCPQGLCTCSSGSKSSLPIYYPDSRRHLLPPCRNAVFPARTLLITLFKRVPPCSYSQSLLSPPSPIYIVSNAQSSSLIFLAYHFVLWDRHLCDSPQRSPPLDIQAPVKSLPTE